MFGYLSCVQKTHGELLKSKVVCFVRRREWHNGLWLPKVPVVGERGMDGTREGRMWAYSLGSCPVIHVDRMAVQVKAIEAMVGTMARKRW